MCGIVGIYKKNGLDNDDIERFSEMLKRCQKRGYDATGVLNSGMEMLKAALPSRTFVASDKYKEFALKSIGTNFLIGHCRSATRGIPKENKNNHPIRVPFENDKILLVHNGMVDCGKWDTDEFKGQKDNEMVDTYIFSNAINHFCNDIGTQDLFRVVKMAFEDVHKASKFNESVIVVANSKEIVFCKSTGKPMVIQVIDKGEKILFGSEDNIIDLEVNGALKSGTPIKLFYVMQDHSITSISVENGDRIECLLDTIPEPKPTILYYKADEVKSKKNEESENNKKQRTIDEELKTLEEWKERKKKRKNAKEEKRNNIQKLKDDYFNESMDFIDTFDDVNIIGRSCLECIHSKGYFNGVDTYSYEIIEKTRCAIYASEVFIEDAENCQHYSKNGDLHH